MRLEEGRLACLVIIGVLADGTKEVIVLEDGYLESQESWACLLRDLQHWGMLAPVLADGALGFWGALREVYPKTREQRFWVHKIANVLDKLPKRLQARAKALLHEVMRALDRQNAKEDIERFELEFEARYPKAVKCLVKDKEVMLTLFDFSAEHWIHLRITNPIEAAFAMVKSRTRQTKGARSRMARLALAGKLILAAQDRWRKVNTPHLVALVRVGIEFREGKRVAYQDVEESELLEENTPMRIAA